MTTSDLNCGFLPLVDCASLVIAKEIGFAAEENINLVLHREPTWSLIRDKLAFGHLDAALVLSPLPIATSLGIGGVAERLDVLSVASANGNVVGVSKALQVRMERDFEGDFFSTYDIGKSLIKNAKRPLRFGVPFPFSMHKELVLYWLEACGLDTVQGVEMRTIAPSLMSDAIKANEIDAFCVGEPWGSVTIQNTGAHLVLPGSSIWTLAPEKVLAARNKWILENYEAAGGLFRATWRAAKWISDPNNLMAVAEILSRSQYVNVPAAVIDRALTGRIVTDQRGTEVQVPRFLEFFNAQARFPWRSQAIWIANRLSARHGLNPVTARRVARDCFRSDLYREFIAPLGEDTPGASEKIEGMLKTSTPVGSAKGKIVLGPDYFFDGEVFDFDGS